MDHIEVVPHLSGGGRPSERVGWLVGQAQRRLGLDVALLAERRGDEHVVLALAGDGAPFDLAVGGPHALGRTLCARVANGDLPGVLPDARPSVGAYLGVPVRLAGGVLWGTLCALGRHPDCGLDRRDLGFLELLAELAVEDLTELRRQSEHAEVLGSVLDGGDLAIAYQPIVELATGSVLGLEALSRFPAPLRPDQAFAAAHRLGIGVDLERLAVRRAVDRLERLGDGQWLSLNMSPAAVLALAEEPPHLDLPLGRVALELTEHTAIEDYPALRRALATARALGMRLSVDDAGAGYASLRHIIELAPEVIKVDRSLVHGVAADRARRVAVGTFVSLAADLSATIVAEGVEELADLVALQDLGVTAAQGWYLARPTSDPARIADWTAPEQAGSLEAFVGREQGRPVPA